MIYYDTSKDLALPVLSELKGMGAPAGKPPLFMKHFSKATQELFKKWGKQGSKVRTKSLSPNQRRSIASKAARARWGNKNTPSLMPSVRLRAPSWENPVYLEEILAEGGLSEWRDLYHQIANYPFGETAKALKKVVSSVEIYGATKLWESLLSHLQGGNLHD